MYRQLIPRGITGCHPNPPLFGATMNNKSGIDDVPICLRDSGMHVVRFNRGAGQSSGGSRL
jgi:alpha/beta superfamily hydrolase